MYGLYENLFSNPYFLKKNNIRIYGFTDEKQRKR
jgi:hypothetical protein